MAESVCARTSAQSPACFSTAYAKRPQWYPSAPRHDLTVALAQIDRATVGAEPDGTEHRLLTLASDWLAQVVKDLACAHVSEDHTSEFFHALGDVLALVHGVMALDLQRGDQSASALRAAATLIERGKDTLSAMEGGAE
ncbi:hypothetical protein AAFF27_16590 [Xylophilus sp. GW821-FHT01B05]